MVCLMESQLCLEDAVAIQNGSCSFDFLRHFLRFMKGFDGGINAAKTDFRTR